MLSWIYKILLRVLIPFETRAPSADEIRRSTTRCDKCKEYRHTLTCQCCQKEYTSRHIEYYGHYCDVCINFRRRLHTGSLTEDEIVPGLMICVEYDMTIQDHDGYCSDTCDETTEQCTKKYYFQHPKILSEDDFDDNGTLINNLSYFVKEEEPHGNGYCGMSTQYCLKRAWKIKETNTDLYQTNINTTINVNVC